MHFRLESFYSHTRKDEGFTNLRKHSNEYLVFTRYKYAYSMHKKHLSRKEKTGLLHFVQILRSMRKLRFIHNEKKK
jgi:hypothetical protein